MVSPARGDLVSTPLTANLRLSCCRDSRVGYNNYGQYHEKEKKASPICTRPWVYGSFTLIPPHNLLFPRPCLYFPIIAGYLGEELE